jgi:hypothetical protein
MKPRGVVVVEDGVSPACPTVASACRRRSTSPNRPILGHVLDAFQLAGVEEVVVATSVAVAGEIRERLDARDNAAIRYLEQAAARPRCRHPAGRAPRRRCAMHRPIAPPACWTNRWRAS